MKKIVLILLPLFLFTFIACTVGDGTSQREASEALQFGIGEKVEFNNHIITVKKVDDTYIDTTYPVIEGEKQIAVEIVYKNNSSIAPFDFNHSDWRLFDSDGNNYITSIRKKEPFLDAGTLFPGEETRGWIVFDIQDDAEDLVLLFEDIFKTGINGIEFPLDL